jgi:hypothetical protein
VDYRFNPSKEGSTLTKKKALSSWVKAFFQAIVAISAFIAYGSQRVWFIEKTNSWFVGFFEGICAMIIIFFLADKYGDAVNEVYQGLRELGHQRITREAKKGNQ